jgi:hypothetical protein
MLEMAAAPTGRPKSLPDCAKSSVAWELENAAHKMPGNNSSHGESITWISEVGHIYNTSSLYLYRDSRKAQKWRIALSM